MPDDLPYDDWLEMLGYLSEPLPFDVLFLALGIAGDSCLNWRVS